MGSGKDESLSSVALVPAGEWPVFELLSGRILDSDGTPGFGLTDFYAQFAPTYSTWGQGKFRFAATRYTYYTDLAGTVTSEEIPLGVGYWLFDGDTPELRIKKDNPGLPGDHKYFSPIRELISALHVADITFHTDFATVSEPGIGVTDITAATPADATLTAMTHAQHGVLVKAKQIFDEVDCVDEVADVVTAREKRTRPELLRQQARLRAAMCGTGQVHTTQYFSTLQAAETARLGELVDLEQRLYIGRDSYRKQMLSSIVEQTIGLYVTDLSWAQEYGRASLYEFRLRQTALHDKLEADIAGDKANKLVNLEAYDYAWQAIAVLNGAPMVPRPMTTNQRIAAAVVNGASAGLQVGAATGNIAVGAVVGIGAIAAQLWGMN
jgi:hypothetical protein